MSDIPLLTQDEQHVCHVICKPAAGSFDLLCGPLQHMLRIFAMLSFPSTRKQKVFHAIHVATITLFLLGWIVFGSVGFIFFISYPSVRKNPSFALFSTDTYNVFLLGSVVNICGPTVFFFLYQAFHRKRGSYADCLSLARELLTSSHLDLAQFRRKQYLLTVASILLVVLCVCALSAVDFLLGLPYPLIIVASVLDFCGLVTPVIGALTVIVLCRAAASVFGRMTVSIDRDVANNLDVSRIRTMVLQVEAFVRLSAVVRPVLVVICVFTLVVVILSSYCIFVYSFAKQQTWVYLYSLVFVLMSLWALLEASLVNSKYRELRRELDQSLLVKLDLSDLPDLDALVTFMHRRDIGFYIMPNRAVTSEDVARFGLAMLSMAAVFLQRLFTSSSGG
jgi:hypothetical protein